MLHKTLFELPFIAMSRSDRVLDVCLSYLKSYKPSFQPIRQKLQANFKQAVHHTIVDMQANQHRIDDVDRAVNRYWQGCNSGCYSLNYLQSVSERYLEFNGNRFVVKADLNTEYQALINYIHPCFLIGAGVVEALKSKQLSFEPVKSSEQIKSVEQMFDDQCPLGFNSQGNSEFADNHVHFGGVNGSEVLTRFLFHRVDRFKLLQHQKQLPRVPEFGLINSYQYDLCTLVSTYRVLFDEFCRYCFAPDDQANDFQSLTAHLKIVLKQAPLNQSCRLRNQYRLKADRGKNNEQKALLLMVKLAERGDTHQALIAFAVAILSLLNQEKLPIHMRVLGIALMHLVNILRAYVVMSGVGLTHFVDFFNSGIRGFNNESTNKESLRWLLAGNNKSALKVTGPGDHGDLQWYGNMASQASQMNKSRASNYQHLHFCLHFVRDFSLNGRQVEAVQQKIYGDANRLRYLLKSQTKYYGKPHRAKRTPLEVDARALIRGFDVAGNENELPIHVFAPALRFLRDKSTDITLLNGKPKLFKARYLSIHAGEDFSHLISGLRHIDETVYYCNMGKGDRIGHGLALGVMPNEWAKRQCQAFVGCEEYLWNTVWLLHYAKILKRANLIGVLEERLKSWQNRFLGELQPFELLWAYWQCRGNSYLHEKRTHHCETLKDRKYWVLNKVEDDWRKPFAQIRFKLQLLQRQKPQYITVNFLSTLENMLGKTSNDNMVEFIKPTELEFYQQLQDYLMVKYSESGLSIEVCPSSNISLGRFEQYHQHPIFRWHPPSEKMYEKYGFDQFKLRNETAVSVCINTDDPGIFPTKIEQEYVLLKNAAMQFDDVTENIASEWIEGIRRNSLAIFEQSHDTTNLFSSPNADFAQAQQPSRSR